MPDDAYTRRMQQLRSQRVFAERDRSLGFMAKDFAREVAKPFKELEGLAELWAELIPADLAEHTRLESLRRGVLHVVVDSSGINYELDRLLRGGVQRELTRRHKGNALRQVKLRVGAVDPDGPSA